MAKCNIISGLEYNLTIFVKGLKTLIWQSILLCLPLQKKGSMEQGKRMIDALDKYEKGELGLMATYAEIRGSENELIDAAGNDKVMKRLIRVMAKTSRLYIRQLRFNTTLKEIKNENSKQLHKEH